MEKKAYYGMFIEPDTSTVTLWFGSPSGLYYSRMSEGLIKGEIYSNL